jgi:hypothetical protein
MTRQSLISGGVLVMLGRREQDVHSIGVVIVKTLVSGQVSTKCMHGCRFDYTYDLVGVYISP